MLLTSSSRTTVSHLNCLECFFFLPLFTMHSRVTTTITMAIASRDKVTPVISGVRDPELKPVLSPAVQIGIAQEEKI